MKGTLILPSILLVTTTACRPHETHPAQSIGIERYPSARDLYPLAEAYRAKHELPALGIGIIHEGRIVGLGMAGERALGSGDWATLEDAFDIASCSKSVTATIAAMLVEHSRARWDMTFAEVFPELRSLIQPGYAGATLELLLRHRAGLNHEMNRNDHWAGWQQQHSDESPTEQRLAFTKAALQRPPRSAPGTETSYTSDGYIVAGSILERLAGQDWEQLVRTQLFEPLELRSMRYGVATQVSGHEARWFGRSLVVAPDPAEYGSQPFGAPAGFLRSTVPDLLRYLDFHIQGERGRGRILQRSSFERLHRAVDKEQYALGWATEVRRDERGQIVEHSVYHGGYSGRSRANIWFVPETEWGTAIVMNHGRGDDSISADIFYALIREFGLLPVRAPQ